MASIPSEILYSPTSNQEEVGAVIPTWQLGSATQSDITTIHNNSNFAIVLTLGLVGGLAAVLLVVGIFWIAMRWSDQLCGAPMHRASESTESAQIYTAYHGLADG